MDEKFQDRIDNYLLNRMDDAEKTEFLREIEQDKEKKEQLEFTQDVKKIWLWISGVAAVLVVGFFAIKPMFDYESSPNYNGAPMEQMRGGDEVFSPAPADSTDNDTIKYNIEKKVNPDE